MQYKETMINTDNLTEKEKQSLQNLRQKLYQGAISEDLILNYIAVLTECCTIVPVSTYKKIYGVHYNTAKSRVKLSIGGVGFCTLESLCPSIN